MAPAYHTPTLESVSVTLAPQSAGSSGKIIRYALIFETLANLFGIGFFLYFAERAPAFITAPRPANAMVARLMAHANKPLPVSTFTVEMLVGFILTMTVPLVLCLPNTKRAVESRPTVYATLLAGEVVLIVQCALEATTARNGLHPARCWQVIANLAPFAVWRIWMLWGRPEWFGSYKEGTVKKA
jgi:hypothetical protein